MKQMIFSCHAEDQDNIKINDYNLAKMSPKTIINKLHKSGRGISKTEGHDHPLKETKLGLKGCLPGVPIIHTNLMIARCQIHFSKKQAPFNWSNRSSMSGSEQQLFAMALLRA